MTPPIPTDCSPSSCCASPRVHRIQKRHLEHRGLGITPAQSRLLRTLAHYGSPPRMADLAERLEVVPRAVTTLVDGLETAGKVRRVPDPGNRRVIRIELTDDGRAALRELHAGAGPPPRRSSRR